MPFVNISNVNYYYELLGQGQPLVLIAGYTCDHTFWAPIAERLSAQFQVLIFDNRGIGQTKDQQEELSAELLADDTMALTHALDMKKPHIVGHSMGGNIAQMIGVRHSHAIGKLAILASSAKWRQAMLGSVKSLWALRQYGCPFELLAQATLPWIFGEAFLSDNSKTSNLIKLALENPFPQTVEDQGRQLSMLLKFDGRTVLTEVLCPTLLICGKQDVAVLPNEMQAMHNQVSKSELLELDCAHNMIHELPEHLTQSLIEYFKRVI